MDSVKATTMTGKLVEGAHVHRNLSTPQLVEAAIARGEASLADNGALVALTGARTGRSPRDKFIVRDAITSDTVDWGKVNQPFDPAKFEALLARVVAHMRERDLYVLDLFAGADETLPASGSDHRRVCLARPVREAVVRSRAGRRTGRP